MLIWFKKFERTMVVFLLALMVVVIALAAIDLLILIGQDVLTPPIGRLDVKELLDIFGAFMLVVIGIELLESLMKTYLVHEQPHIDVVVSVAIIAIARKVIILDLKEVESLSLLGIAAIILALTGGLFLIRRSGYPPSGIERRGAFSSKAAFPPGLESGERPVAETPPVPPSSPVS